MTNHAERITNAEIVKKSIEDYNELKNKLVEQANLINEKYDQLNKDLFDFKDTLDLVKKENKKGIAEMKRNIKIGATGFSIFSLIFLFIQIKRN